MAEETRCVLRLYGAPQGRLAAAVALFAPQWRAEAQWKSRGAETLLAVHADTPTGLKKAAQSLRSSFGADVYGAGDTSLAAAAVQALEAHDRLLACGDAAAGALLESRLEKVPGAEKVYDFGTMSYADAKVGPQIEKRARAKLGGEGDKPDPVRLALARAQAARRIVGTELAVACAERESDHVLVLSTKKGCWLRTVSAADNPGLWLLDMVRRAAAGLPQAEGTGFLPAGQVKQSDPPGRSQSKDPTPKKKHPLRVLLAVLVILALFIAKGFSGVVVYNALVVVVSLILPLPAALAISGVGTALCLSISYWMGRSTRTDSLEGLLSRHPKLNKYFTATQQYGFVFCFTIHMLGLNMELLGVLFGMMRLNFWTYLSASWLSIAPGMVCLCILGNNLDFKSPVFWAMLALNLVLLLGSLWYTRHKLVQSSSRT